MSQLLTINLAKGPGTPWGFRLQGGKDFAQPLCIQKVNVGSVAAQAGLLAGDAIVSIGNDDALTLRHKEAQDAIVRAGNCFPIVIQRGSITWKPQVTALAQPKKTTQGPVLTETSLAKKPLEEPRICKGFNAKPKGFGEVNGTPITVAAYNTPINLYNEENIAEALSSQSEVLGKGCLGVNFKKHDKALEDSDVYRMVHEMDKGPKTPTPGPASPAVYHSPQPAPLTPSEMIGTPEIPVQGASFRILEKYLTHDGTGVSKLPSSSPAAPGGGHQLSSGQNVCAECGRLIVGVFVRIKDKNLHADCFKCNTCGSSLKNVGYYNISDKMYCDVHAKQAAKHNPPAPNMVPVTVKPGSAAPAGAFPAAVAKSSPLPEAVPPGDTQIEDIILGEVAPEPVESESLPFVAPAPVATGGSSANPNAFGAPSGGLNVRSHIPKKGPAPAPAPVFTPAPAPVFTPAPASVFTPPKPVVPASQPAALKPAFGGISMPKPTPLPDLSSFSSGPKPPGMGGKGLASQRTAPKRGRGIMSPAHASRIPICSGCNIQIRGPFVTALGKNWCPDHFHCATESCRKQLIDIGFVEEQGRLHCEDCYEKFLAPTCGKCEKRIKGDCLNAVGKQFHPECFCCAYCGKVFGSGAFYLEDGLPYCETDWNDLFTTKCVGCGFPIEAGDRWVEALNNNYHSQCFKCSKCHKNLEGQSFFAKGGKPFCKSHAQRGF